MINFNAKCTKSQRKALKYAIISSMKKGITEYFEDVELYEEYDGYFCSMADVITIAILGSICGLRNIHQIHQWAANDRVSEFLKEKFGIDKIIIST